MSKVQDSLSPLEQKLAAIPAIDPSAEHEIDKLRLVLQGQLGTPAQRSMLLRIIKSTKLPAGHKNLTLVLAETLGDAKTRDIASRRHSYITNLSAAQAAIRAARKQREKERQKRSNRENRAEHRRIKREKQAQREARMAAQQRMTETAPPEGTFFTAPLRTFRTAARGLNIGDLVAGHDNMIVHDEIALEPILRTPAPAFTEAEMARLFGAGTPNTTGTLNTGGAGDVRPL